MPEPSRTTLSDLSHRPDRVLGQVDDRDLLVTRRNKEDVLVSTVARETAVRATLGVLADAILNLGAEAASKLVDSAIQHMYRWTRDLPEDERLEFATRYARVVQACVARNDFQPLAIFLRQWEYTAAIHSDEEMMRLFLAPIPDDATTGKAVAKPQLAGEVINVAGKEIRAQDIVSEALGVDEVTQAAAVSVPDEQVGSAVELYVTLNEPLQDTALVESKIVSRLNKRFGGIVRPKRVWIVPDLPKTSAGNVNRQVLAAISNDMEFDEGTKLANPEVVEQIREQVQAQG